jgi:hypothetical protein
MLGNRIKQESGYFSRKGVLYTIRVGVAGRFGDMLHPIPWQTDHPFCWQRNATDALAA